VGGMKLALRIVMVTLVAVMVFAIAGIAATWAPDRSVESLKARWAQPPSQFIDVAGMQVHLRDEGPRDDPVPIVLLHGTSASLHTWDGWVQTLSKTRRVIRFDMPAFGLTGPNPQNDYSIKSYVTFVTAAVDKLGVQRFVIGGNSLGGQIAWETAHALPARVEKLILVDSGGYAFVPKSMPLGFQIARLPVLRNLMEYTLPRGIIQHSIENVYGNPSLVTPALIDRYFDLTLRAGNRKALSYRLDQGFASDESMIKSLKLPTLILWGAKDRLIPPESGQNFARDISGSKLVMFEALGHVPHEENVQATVAEVVKFLGQ
jgi:pimeloyl-ACP methyl ester carboxylesterase